MSKSTDLAVMSPVTSSLAVASKTDAWLKEAASGSSLMTAYVSHAKISQLEADAKGMGNTVTGVMFGTLGAMFSGIFELMASTHAGTPGHMVVHFNDPLSVVMVVGASALVTGITSVPVFRKHQKRSAVKLETGERVQKAGLRLWLESRYGLSVSEGTLTDLTESLLAARETSFQDISGKSWQLRKSAEAADSWIVNQGFVKVEAEALTVGVPGGVVAGLPGEAGIIHTALLARLAKLKAYSLQVESSHAVLRVEEDLRQALNAFRKLTALDAVGKAEARLVPVLSALNEELRVLIDTEIAAVEKDLEVQGGYLKSRQLDTGILPGLMVTGSDKVKGKLGFVRRKALSR